MERRHARRRRRAVTAHRPQVVVALGPLLAALGLLACSSDLAPADLAVGDLGADLATIDCQDNVVDLTDGGLCLRTVRGNIADDSGAAVANQRISVCGVACFFGQTDASGRFSMHIAELLNVDRYAFELDGRPTWANMYVPLPAIDNAGLVAFAAPLLALTLPASGPTIFRDGSAQTLTSGEVTLLVAAGTTIDLDVEDVALGAVGAQLRAARSTAIDRFAFAADAAGGPPAVLYALAPFEAQLSQPVGLSVANSLALPANAAVEILVQHGLVNAAPPAGALEHAADALVSADGQRIVTVAGQGITRFTWIALRPR